MSLTLSLSLALSFSLSIYLSLSLFLTHYHFRSTSLQHLCTHSFTLLSISQDVLHNLKKLQNQCVSTSKEMECILDAVIAFFPESLSSGWTPSGGCLQIGRRRQADRSGKRTGRISHAARLIAIEPLV